jgi:hypothetical protein
MYLGNFFDELFLVNFFCKMFWNVLSLNALFGVASFVRLALKLIFGCFDRSLFSSLQGSHTFFLKHRPVVCKNLQTLQTYPNIMVTFVILM